MPAPVIISISPKFSELKGGGVVDIEGLNLDVGTLSLDIFFNGIPATNVVTVDNTLATCVVPAYPEQDIVTISIVADTGTATLQNSFYYVSEPLPTSYLVFGSSFLDHKANYTMFGEWTFLDKVIFKGSFTGDGGVGSNLSFVNYDSILMANTGFLLSLNPDNGKTFRIQGLKEPGVGITTKPLLIDPVSEIIYIGP